MRLMVLYTYFKLFSDLLYSSIYLTNLLNYSNQIQNKDNKKKSKIYINLEIHNYKMK